MQRIYEDNVAGKINDKRYEALSNQYEQEQAELEQLISKLQADLDSFDDSKDRAEKFLSLMRRYKDFTELTPTILHEFVDRIEIHERANRRFLITTQKVDIYLNFIGNYTPPTNPIRIEPDPEVVKEQERRMKNLMYQREYKLRREANGGKPLGYFEGQRPDERTPEQKEADEAAKKQRLKEYHAKWYQDNKERMNAERAAKRNALSPEELAAYNAQRKQKRREYDREWRDKNRAKINAYSNEYRKRKRNLDTANP